MLLLFTETGLDWQRWIGEGVAILLVIVVLGFILRVLPVWKEIRLKEIDIRTKEAETSGQIATALLQSASAQTHLGTALEQLGSTIKDIAIEQRKATENVMLLQRVNANESHTITETVDHLIDRMNTLEENFKAKGFYETRPKAITKRGS